MKKKSLPQSIQELNHIMRLIQEYAQKREESANRRMDALIPFMYRSGFTVTEIAKVLNISKQEVSKKYPYKKYVTEEDNEK